MMTHYLFPRNKGLIHNSKIGIKAKSRVPLGKYKYKTNKPNKYKSKNKNKQRFTAMRLGSRYLCCGGIMSVRVQLSTISTKKTGLLSTFYYASATLQKNKYHQR